jgi:outer membrane protein assembly factor BamA
VGGGFLVTFKTDVDTEVPRSTVQATGIYSFSNGFTVGSRYDTIWLNDSLRFNGVLDYTDMESDYAGVGFANGLSVGRGPLTTEYDERSARFKPDLLYRVAGDLFAGVNFDVFHEEARNVAPRIAADPGFRRFGSRYTDAGAGLTLSYDTRDDTVVTQSGSLAQLRTTHYRDWLGSDFEFDAIDLDLRTFFPVLRDGSTLGLMLQSRYTTGDVPWASLTSVGDSRDLRGYHYGQFRDRTGIWALAEYRHQFRKRNSTDLSRFGFVTWGGIGFVGEDYGDLDGHSLPNGGIGFRYDIQERRKLRLDFGVGRNGESGFYLSFNEAF